MNTHAPRALILCGDARLTRLLENELMGLGFAPTVSAAPPADVRSFSLLVADTDEFALPDELPCPAVLFGRSPPHPCPGNAVYLPRPFGLTALEETIRRLTEDRPATAEATPLPRMSMGEDRSVTVGDTSLTLTGGEYALLRCLLEHKGDPVPRETLASLLGGGGNIVDVYICKLRGKLEKPLGRRAIYTVRGVGYRLDEAAFG